MGDPMALRALNIGALSPTLISGPTNVKGFPFIVTAPGLSSAIAIIPPPNFVVKSVGLRLG
jgi:hypothetical protein